MQDIRYDINYHDHRKILDDFDTFSGSVYHMVGEYEGEVEHEEEYGQEDEKRHEEDS